MTSQPGPLRRAGLLAGRHADRLPQGRAAASCVTPTGRCEPGHLSRAGGAAASPALIAEDGVRPQFGAASDRVYLLRRRDDEDKRAARLASTSTAATSADHLTQRRRHRVPDLARRAVGRLPRALQRLRRCPSCAPARRSTSVPRRRRSRCARVTRDAGEYLHWSGDSAAPPLVARARSSSRASSRTPSPSSPARPTKLPEPPASGLDIGFEAAARRAERAPSPWSAARIVTMKGGRGDRGRHDRRRGQPHRGGRPARRGRGPGRRAQWSTSTGKTIMPGLDRRPLARRDGQRRHHAAAELGHLRLARLRRHDASTTRRTTRTTIFAASEMARAGLILGAAHLLDRHDPLRRRRRLHGRDRLLDDAASHLRRMKAVGRVQRQELQPAAPRPAPADHRRRARAGHDGGARGRLAVRAQHDHGRRRPHRRRALDPGREHLRGRARSSGRQTEVGYTPTLIVGYGGHLGRELLVRSTTNVWEDQRLLDVRAAARSRRALAPARSWRRTRSTTTSTSRRSPSRPQRRRACRCNSAPTASARAWARTGRCGCSPRAA